MAESNLNVAIQSINAAMTPALLFTASSLLLAGLQNKYSTLIQAVRALNDERRQLLRRPTLANWEKARSESIVEQIPHLLARAKLVRNSVFMLYLGTLLFMLSSCFIGLAHLGWQALGILVIILFGLGLVGLMIGVSFALGESWLSYRVVRMEVGLKAMGEMISATTTQLPQFITTLLAPMFMVSGAASMNWGLQRLQSMLTHRIHKLNDERAELQNEVVPTAFSKMRLRQIAEQLQSMMRRARYTRNAIASFYAACLSLLLCSVSIAAVTWLELEMTWICTAFFELGMLFIYVALAYTLVDVGLSYHAVQVDSKAAQDSAEMVGVNV